MQRLIYTTLFLLIIILIFTGYIGHAILYGISLGALLLSILFRRQVRSWDNNLTAIGFKLAGDWFISWSLSSFIILSYWMAIDERPLSFFSHFKEDSSILLSFIIMVIILTIKLSYYMYNKFYGASKNNL